MNPSIQKDLFTLEKQERAMNLKFGVIYAQESQKTDDEFLSNQEESKSFINFLDLLGERINLKVSDLYLTKKSRELIEHFVTRPLAST